MGASSPTSSTQRLIPTTSILPSPKTPLEVHPVPIYTPGPKEILIKNEFIALNAIEAKIAIRNESLVKELVEKGPYDVVVDFVSVESTFAVMGRVVEAQGGRRLFTMQPGWEGLPAGVERVFGPYTESLYEERNRGLQKWAVEAY
ncbi:hypothetical protein PMIN06_004038 [Paraphaeosphaeria minitans]